MLLNVAHAGQFLDAVEDALALLERVLVVVVARVDPLRLDQSAHLVDLAVQPS